MSESQREDSFSSSDYENNNTALSEEEKKEIVLRREEQEIKDKIEILKTDFLLMRARPSLLMVYITVLLEAVAWSIKMCVEDLPHGLKGVNAWMFGCLIVLCAWSVLCLVFTFQYDLYQLWKKKLVQGLAASFWIIFAANIMFMSSVAPYNLSALLVIAIILLYLTIPIGPIYTTIGGYVILSIHAVVCLTELRQHPDLTFSYYKMVAIELASMVAANMIGIYIQMTLNRFDKKTFNQTYENIKARIELEEERQRQEQLLLNIIPAELAYKMRQSMLERLNEQVDPHSSTRRLWHDFYVREHKGVSILFADLVNFTQLTTKCSAKDLVEMLNEIYGKFDSLARTNDCMRIKTLGDCYCCVSGMPVSRPHHATNVVKTGVQMVQAIKLARQMTTSSLDMRIGVHSGNVLCGVLGTVKWKFDIWSEDVAYANFLESTGVPGKIHISKVTKLQLGDTFSMDKVQPPVTNSLGEPQETFLINEMRIVASSERRKSFQRSRSINSNSSTQQLYSYLQTWGAPKPFGNFAGNASDVDKVNSRSIEMMEASYHSSFQSQNCCLSCCPKTSYQIDNFFLRPTSKHNQKILNSEYKLICIKSSLLLTVGAIIYLIPLLAINWLGVNCQVTVLILSGVSIAVLLAFLIFFIYQRKKTRGQYSKKERLTANVAYYAFFAVWTALNYVLASLGMHYVTTYANVVVDINDNILEDSVNTTLYTHHYHVHYHENDPFVIGLLISLLCLVSGHIFVFTSYVIKLAINLACLVTSIMFLVLRDLPASNKYDKQVDPLSKGIPWIMLNLLILIITCFHMVFIARQNENANKALTLWKLQFHVENEDVTRTQHLTKLLLSNILPQHVATHYLSTNGADPYHESYENVCIMFAAVVNFDEFFRMSSDNDRQHQCLRLLNEIIGDFDRLLQTKPKYSTIEKMKTVGSTYMAAAGLQPGKDFNNEEQVLISRHSEDQFVQIMTDFALNLFSILDNINKHSFNNFRLRIGLSNGPVIAGVVGAQKPQYDVWGDTVNMASRMESGGILDMIQMTENTGLILKDLGYPVRCRGKTVVKGKSELLTTYLLEADSHSLSSIPLRERSSISSYLSEE